MPCSGCLFLLPSFAAQLAEAVKRGACSLGSSQPDSQVMVINAVKDVASALGDLINCTKLASGKPIHDPSMQDLKESARVCTLQQATLSSLYSLHSLSLALTLHSSLQESLSFFLSLVSCYKAFVVVAFLQCIILKILFRQYFFLVFYLLHTQNCNLLECGYGS